MIYLDNAATTRPNAAAFNRAQAFLGENFFNPSASYGGGFLVHSELERARATLLSAVADPEKFELIFTSGGTESDNQAIFCAAKRGNAVTTAGEHAAVERCFNELKNRGVEPRYAPVKKSGAVDAEALLSLVDEKTSLVSVIHVNNETGAINDIAAIARAVKRKNPRCLFHSDGVQAFGKIPFRLPQEVDLYSVSAHKIGGIKGTGALIKRRDVALPPHIFGGGQEGNARSGTENVLGILCFSYAAQEKFKTLSADSARLSALRPLFLSKLGGAFLPLSEEGSSPYILAVSAPGTRGEVLSRMLWENGVVVGTGSACSSKHRYSRVLAACGYDKNVLDGVLRVSFSPTTCEEEAMRAAEAMNEAVRRFKEKL